MLCARFGLLMCLVALASACVTRTSAGISYISDSAVTVLQDASTDPNTINAEAQRGCGIYGKNAVKASVLVRGDNVLEHLYACK